MTNQSVQTNRHGPQNKGCNQADYKEVDKVHWLDPDMPCLYKQCRSRSVGFFSWLLKKPTDLYLHCLSLSRWIFVNNLDQVMWFQAENYKWAWHLNLFNMTRVKKLLVCMLIGICTVVRLNTVFLIFPGSNGVYLRFNWNVISLFCLKKKKKKIRKILFNFHCASFVTSVGGVNVAFNIWFSLPFNSDTSCRK